MCPSKCETMLEQYEEVVEVWYFHHQDQKLEDFLCKRHVLGVAERGQTRLGPKLPFFLRPAQMLTWVLSRVECLNEVWKGDPASGGGAEEDSAKTRLADEL